MCVCVWICCMLLRTPLTNTPLLRSQMRGGAFPGRLIIPMYVPTGGYIIYSDDFGANWQRGGCAHSDVTGLGAGQVGGR